MKTKILSLLLVLASIHYSIAQRDGRPFYVYKTKDDFFSKKKTYAGWFVKYKGDNRTKVVLADTITNVETTNALKDLCFAYESYGDAMIYHVAYKEFYPFAGGIKEAYAVLIGNGYSYTFDKEGFVNYTNVGVTSTGQMPYTWAMFVVKEGNPEKKVFDVKDLMKDAPELNDQYLAARKKRGYDSEFLINESAWFKKYLMLKYGKCK